MDVESLRQRGFSLGPVMIEPLRLRLVARDDSVQLQRKVMEVLLVLAAAEGRVVTRERLVEQVWRGRIVTEDAINRCVADLRKAFVALGVGAAIETVPRVGYRLALPLSPQPAGRPPTGETLPPAAPEEPAPLQRQPLVRWLALASAAALVSMAVWLLWPAASEDVPPTAPLPRMLDADPPPPASIAVLPFDNLTGDSEQAFLALGLSEELTGRLARLPGLRVTSRTSAEAADARSADAVEIGRWLRVRYLLEGSLRREGDQWRVTSQLIDTSDGYHVWSKTIETALGGVLAAQQDIARRVADTLEANLTGPLPAARATDVHPDAYQAYLQARHWERHGDWPQALAAYRVAESVDPGFAAAAAGVGRAELWVNSALAATDAAALDALVLPHLERALVLDPALSDAYVTRGWLRRWTRRPGGGDAYRAAVEIDPNNAIAHQSLAAYEYQQGHVGRALELARRAHELDPLASRTHGFLNAMLASFGLVDELEASLRRMEFVAERSADGATLCCYAQELLGRPDRGLRCAEEAEREWPDDPGLIETARSAAAALGDSAREQRELERLAARGDEAATLRLRVLRQDAAGLEAEIDRILALGPETGLAAELGSALARLGRWQAAQAVFTAAGVTRRAAREETRSITAVAALPAVVAAGRATGAADAEQWLDLLLELTARPLADGAVSWKERVPRVLALTLAGREAEALAMLEAAAGAPGSPFDVAWLEGHPAFAPLRELPAAQAVLDRVRARQAELRAAYATDQP